MRRRVKYSAGIAIAMARKDFARQRNNDILQILVIKSNY
jgi:hypothetical protein